MNGPVTAMRPPATMITPNLIIKDEMAAYWFAQINLRLRREVSWCWYQRMQQAEIEGVLPPVTDAAAENLDMVRHASQKQQFFQDDLTAGFLSEQINSLAMPTITDSYWQRVVSKLKLSDVEQFVLALGLATQLDAGLAPIFATCLNDLSRPYATLALAQRLWDDPLEIVACADPHHCLFRFGLLRDNHADCAGQIWQRPLEMPASVAQTLADANADLPLGLQCITPRFDRELDTHAELLIARLQNTEQMQIVPLLGPRDSAYADWAATLNNHMGKSVVVVKRLPYQTNQLTMLACVCWIRDLDILLPERWLTADKASVCHQLLFEVSELPLRWYLPLDDSKLLSHLSENWLTPSLTIEALDYQTRVDTFKRHLPAHCRLKDHVIEDCASRFRFQEKNISRIARVFESTSLSLTETSFRTACANEAAVEMDHLAQLVKPRFKLNDLVLPTKQTAQLQAIIHAMQTLSVVHHRWGTAQVWNESGLSVLFCGPPGTGKTMSAEILSNELNLPMFRIDLSQVINKYIGETEKNLRRIFDASELQDCILFFDEADALFGKRTEVKDAHDRFANIEISYLLERMERFKGLAILATNRRKDLDEAFMRRLRYLIEFPVPEIAERKRIWANVFPDAVNITDLDIGFLAKNFQLSGGYIQSIAFNACLGAADAGNPSAPAKVSMPAVLTALKRELEKINRTASDEIFGQYQHLLIEQVS
jgi:hypothetical protein